MARILGVDGREIVSCDEHMWMPTTVVLQANTPFGQVPAVIVLCAHCLARNVQLLDVPGLTAMAPPPDSVPVPE